MRRHLPPTVLPECAAQVEGLLHLLWSANPGRRRRRRHARACRPPAAKIPTTGAGRRLAPRPPHPRAPLVRLILSLLARARVLLPSARAEPLGLVRRGGAVAGMCWRHRHWEELIDASERLATRCAGLLWLDLLGGGKGCCRAAAPGARAAGTRTPKTQCSTGVPHWRG